jgi:hypothetical protein
MLKEICIRICPKKFKRTIKANPGRWIRTKVAKAFHIERNREGMLGKVFLDSYQEYFMEAPML